MATRQTNLALLLALLGALATGVAAFAVGTGWVLWVVIAHGVLGLCVVVLAPWKSAIAAGGIDRRPAASTWPSIVLGVLVVVTVVSGVLRTAGVVRSYGPLTDMQVHVGAAVAAVPFGLWHVVKRGPRPRRRDLSRRNLLRAGAVVGTTGLLYLALEGVWRLLSLAGGDRRATGSHDRGSHDPSAMPVVQWFDDRVQHLDVAAWELAVVAADGTAKTWSYGEVAAADDRITATLDCTGGWFAEQDWEGIRLGRLLGDLGTARSVQVISATGYSRRFPVRDVSGLLLATRLAGEQLSAGHGAPVRLVAPGRRGFWWVKWVTRIELSQRPWWLDLPFPIT
ncbi:MAG: molybdopterin-dependent oxidoreductase [Actinobacteria bacterium]|nr:molybdopterin-dependent oxidoreductase [Actinomycetota bacterium]